jgi:hypothetical protein
MKVMKVMEVMARPTSLSARVGLSPRQIVHQASTEGAGWIVPAADYWRAIIRRNGETVKGGQGR